MKKIIGLILITIFEFLNVAQASYMWEKKANFGGGPRDAAFGFSVGNYGYAGCGRTTNGFSNDLWQYDPSSNTWSQKMNYPGNGRFGIISFAIGNFGYAGTGWTASSAGTSDFYEYNPNSNSWTAKNNFPGSPLYTAVSFVIGDKAYVGLGCCANRDEFYEYNPGTDMWTQITSFPDARVGAFAFSINGKGYVGCGYGSGNVSYNDMYEYDPVNDNWTLKSSLPGLARRAPVGFAIGNYGFVGMGYNDTTYMTDFYRYEPSINTWSIIASIGGIPRYWGFAFAIDHYGYSGGGSYFNISTPLKVDDFWRFSECDGEPIGIIAVPGTRDNYFMNVIASGNQELHLTYDIGQERNVVFQLYNSLGQIVLNTELSSNSFDRIVNHNLSPGVYIYTVSAPSKVLVKGKVMIN